ncbi:hypothetical protein, partial [Streptomyces sp. NRRL WC-3774]|uniref:hypothetical protein n=1 Tax=Streptomyces sp. NRRL WC-3774 TaxID=1463937 RepID=UPI001F27AC58
MAPAAQTSSAALMCRPYTDPGGTGTSCQRFPSRRSRTWLPSREPISQASPPPATTWASATPAGG